MPKKRSKSKFYAVAVGRQPGIYLTWDECQRQTKGHSRAKFKSFGTREEAQKFVNGGDKPYFRSPTVAEKTSTSIRPNEPDRSTQEEPMLSNGLENNFGRAGEKRLLISIYYDGGARGNPGPAGSGADVVIEKFDEATAPPSKSQVQIRKFLGNTTNNVAEYNGVISGLEEAKQQICQYVKICPQGRVRVMVKGDSNLVTCQLNGSYTCKATKLIPLHRQAKQLTAEICGLGKSNFFDGTTAQVEVIFQHVYREDNKVADTLANEAMDTKRSWTSKVGDDRKKNIAERSV